MAATSVKMNPLNEDINKIIKDEKPMPLQYNSIIQFPLMNIR